VRNTSTQRTKPSQERRDDLLNAAQSLFLDKGVAATTVEDITTGAGVAKGTFYLYFASKEAVLGALRDRFGRQLVRKIDAALARTSAKQWKEKLAVWASTCASVYASSRKLHDVVFHESPPSTPHGLTDNFVVDHLSRLLEAGAEAKAWTVDDPHTTAIFLFGGLHGVVTNRQTATAPADRQRIAKLAEHLFFATVSR
jgi:AcrR family transcriptional regulator